MSMQGVRSQRERRTIARNRRLLILAALVLFAGLFLQITMLSRISLQSKRASAVERELIELNANAENLELSINQYHNLEAIAARAQQLGMEQPDETQIRVVSVAKINREDTSTQTAEGFGGEKVLN